MAQQENDTVVTGQQVKSLKKRYDNPMFLETIGKHTIENFVAREFKEDDSIYIEIQPTAFKSDSLYYASDKTSPDGGDATSVYPIKDETVFLLTKVSAASVDDPAYYKIESGSYYNYDVDEDSKYWYIYVAPEKDPENENDPTPPPPDIILKNNGSKDKEIYFFFDKPDNAFNIYEFTIKNRIGGGVVFVDADHENQFNFGREGSNTQNSRFSIKTIGFSRYGVYDAFWGEQVYIAPVSPPVEPDDPVVPVAEDAVEIATQTLENKSDSQQAISYEFIQTVETKLLFEAATLYKGGYDEKGEPINSDDPISTGLLRGFFSFLVSNLVVNDADGSIDESKTEDVSNAAQWSSNPELGGILKHNVKIKGVVTLAVGETVEATLKMTPKSDAAIRFQSELFHSVNGSIKTITGTWAGTTYYNPVVTISGDGPVTPPIEDFSIEDGCSYLIQSVAADDQYIGVYKGKDGPNGQSYYYCQTQESSGNVNQTWKFTANGDYYNIINNYNNKLLTVDGNYIIQASAAGGHHSTGTPDFQLWKLNAIDDGSNTFRFVCKAATEQAFEVDSSNNALLIQTTPDSSKDTQKWKLLKISS